MNGNVKLEQAACGSSQWRMGPTFFECFLLEIPLFDTSLSVCDCVIVSREFTWCIVAEPLKLPCVRSPKGKLLELSKASLVRHCTDTEMKGQGQSCAAGVGLQVDMTVTCSIKPRGRH